MPERVSDGVFGAVTLVLTAWGGAKGVSNAPKTIPSEVSLPIVNHSFVPKPTTLGKVGEFLAGISSDAVKQAVRIGGRIRKPDFLSNSLLKEVKNVKYQAYTKQLSDYLHYAKTTHKEPGT